MSNILSRTITEIKEWCEKSIKDITHFLENNELVNHPSYYRGGLVVYQEIIDMIDNTSEEIKNE